MSVVGVHVKHHGLHSMLTNGSDGTVDFFVTGA